MLIRLCDWLVISQDRT